MTRIITRRYSSLVTPRTVFDYGTMTSPDKDADNDSDNDSDAGLRQTALVLDLAGVARVLRRAARRDGAAAAAAGGGKDEEGGGGKDEEGYGGGGGWAGEGDAGGWAGWLRQLVQAMLMCDMTPPAWCVCVCVCGGVCASVRA